ncbi:hypothetical protein CR513_34978, partial [Mucuna pruriens]
MLMDRSMIDATNGGALMDKTLAVVRHLISNMACNTQQFRIKGAITNKAVNEVGAFDNLRMENQLTELTSLVRQLAVSQHRQIPQVKVCGICTLVEHLTDMCPTLQEPLVETNTADNRTKLSIQIESESRAIFSSKIWTRAKQADPESQLLSAIGIEISHTTIPTTTATNDANVE